MKRVLSIVLSFSMVLCMMPAFALTAIAEETTQEKADRLKTELETEGTFYTVDMGAIKYIDEVYSKAASTYVPVLNGDMLPYATEFQSKFDEAGLEYSFTNMAGDGFDGVAWMVGGPVAIKDSTTTYATTTRLNFKMVQLIAVDSATAENDIPSTIENNVQESLGINVSVTKSETVEAFLEDSTYPQGLDYYLQKAYVEDNLYTITINSKEYKFFVTKDSISKALGIEKEVPGADGKPYFDDTNKILYTNNNSTTVFETEEEGYDANLKITVNGVQSDYLLPSGYSVCIGTEISGVAHRASFTLSGGNINKLILAGRAASVSGTYVYITGGTVGTIRIGDIESGDRQITNSVYVINSSTACTPTLELGYNNGELISSTVMTEGNKYVEFVGSFNVTSDIKTVKGIYVNGETYITYHANGGSFDGGATELSRYGKIDDTLTASKAGAEFLGWGSSATATVPVSAQTGNVSDVYAVFKENNQTRPFSVSEANGRAYFRYDNRTNTYSGTIYMSDIDIDDIDVVVDCYTLNDEQQIVRAQKHLSFGESVIISEGNELYMTTIQSFSKDGTYENYTICVAKASTGTSGLFVNGSFDMQGQAVGASAMIYEKDGSCTINVPENSSEFDLTQVYVMGSDGSLSEDPIKTYTLSDTSTQIVIKVRKSSDNIANYYLNIVKTPMTSLESKITSEVTQIEAIDASEKTIKFADLEDTGIQSITGIDLTTYFHRTVLQSWGATSCSAIIYEDAEKTKYTDGLVFNEKRYALLRKDFSYSEDGTTYSTNIVKSELVPFTLKQDSNLDSSIVAQIKSDDIYIDAQPKTLNIVTYRNEDKLEDFVLTGKWYPTGNWYSGASVKLSQLTELSEANPELYSKLKGNTSLNVKMTTYEYGGGFFETEHSVGLNYYKGNVSYGKHQFEKLSDCTTRVQAVLTVPEGTKKSDIAQTATSIANEYLSEYSYTAAVTEATAQQLFSAYFNISNTPEYKDAKRAYVIEEGFALYSGDEGTTKDKFIGVFKASQIDTEGLNLVKGESLDYLNVNGEIRTNVDTYQPYYIAAEGLQGGYLLINQDEDIVGDGDYLVTATYENIYAVDITFVKSGNDAKNKALSFGNAWPGEEDNDVSYSVNNTEEYELYGFRVYKLSDQGGGIRYRDKYVGFIPADSKAGSTLTTDAVKKVTKDTDGEYEVVATVVKKTDKDETVLETLELAADDMNAKFFVSENGGEEKQVKSLINIEKGKKYTVRFEPSKFNAGGEVKTAHISFRTAEERALANIEFKNNSYSFTADTDEGVYISLSVTGGNEDYENFTYDSSTQYKFSFESFNGDTVVKSPVLEAGSKAMSYDYTCALAVDKATSGPTTLVLGLDEYFASANIDGTMIEEADLDAGTSAQGWSYVYSRQDKTITISIPQGLSTGELSGLELYYEEPEEPGYVVGFDSDAVTATVNGKAISPYRFFEIPEEGTAVVLTAKSGHKLAGVVVYEGNEGNRYKVSGDSYILALEAGKNYSITAISDEDNFAANGDVQVTYDDGAAASVKVNGHELGDGEVYTYGETTKLNLTLITPSWWKSGTDKIYITYLTNRNYDEIELSGNTASIDISPDDYVDIQIFWTKAEYDYYNYWDENNYSVETIGRGDGTISLSNGASSKIRYSTAAGLVKAMYTFENPTTCNAVITPAAGNMISEITVNGEKLSEQELKACIDENGVGTVQVKIDDDNSYWTVEVKFASGCSHNIEHHAAKASTCTTKGNIEYWYCKLCGKYYSDEECETELAKAATLLPLARHSWNGGTVIKEASTTECGEVQYECTVCHTKKTEALDIVAKAEKEELTDNKLSDELKQNTNLNTAEKVKTAMETEAKKQEGFENAEITSYELKLSVSTDNGGEYQKADSGNIPAEGVEVTIPYPQGKDSTYNYVILHMYDKADGVHEAGDIEVFDNPIKTAEGLKITLTSASPVQIASTPGDGEGALGGTVHGYYGTGNVQYELIPSLTTLKTKLFASKSETYSFAGLANGQYTLRVSADGDYVAREYSVNVGTESNVDVTIRELGDTTLDGARTAEDITRLARHVAKISEEQDAYALKLFDTTRDEEVSAADITHLARFIAKIIDKL